MPLKFFRSKPFAQSPKAPTEAPQPSAKLSSQPSSQAPDRPRRKPRAVIALGGNALQKNGEVSAAAQKQVAAKVGQTIAALAEHYEIIVSHGNGPQVGNILVHEENAATPTAPAMPLETAVAMSQGQIGYWLTQAIDNAFNAQPASNPQASLSAQAANGAKMPSPSNPTPSEARAVSLITQVLVDQSDPAFAHPSKPIGEFYDQATAAELAQTRGWVMREDAGRGYRRVVPSPRPIDIIESASIRTLVDAGMIVIAAGGGGIPVVRVADGSLSGVDAVIDKDFAAAELARLVDADFFVSVTAVPNAYLHFGQPNQTAIGRISRAEILQYLAAGNFGAGSMLPKVEACAEFVDPEKSHEPQNYHGPHGSTRPRYGIITSPDNLAAALALQSGTIITNE